MQTEEEIEQQEEETETQSPPKFSVWKILIKTFIGGVIGSLVGAGVVMELTDKGIGDIQFLLAEVYTKFTLH